MSRSSSVRCRQAPEQTWASCQSNTFFRTATHGSQSPQGAVYPVHSDLLAAAFFTRCCVYKYAHTPFFCINKVFERRLFISFIFLDDTPGQLAPKWDPMGLISIFPHHILSLLMTGHQHFSSLNYWFTEAGALAHSVLTGLSIFACVNKDRREWREEDGDVADGLNTNRAICICPQHQTDPETGECTVLIRNIKGSWIALVSTLKSSSSMLQTSNRRHFQPVLRFHGFHDQSASFL